LAFCLKRRISMFRKLQRLSRGRVALSKGDIPKVREASRALRSYSSFGGGLTCCSPACVACTRIRDAGVFACLFNRLRVLTQGRRQGRMGQARHVIVSFRCQLGRVVIMGSTPSLCGILTLAPKNRHSMGWSLLPAVSPRHRS